ncbi:hypothetical protein NA56DRAFT_707216 [Hyaloscypha hepaticicola]|uniref:Uncharacterized protein n=1 Tax=Hyaloscypha hepaticicola TaxID=2082293 RepID=A0A2J6PV01_9HELO|nr:hypothetical protein NA56DRAFT_707216 [Hyaloscypha hepaticicola]
MFHCKWPRQARLYWWRINSITTGKFQALLYLCSVLPAPIKSFHGSPASLSDSIIASGFEPEYVAPNQRKANNLVAYHYPQRQRPSNRPPTRGNYTTKTCGRAI